MYLLNNYKPYPVIGEQIRDDGFLFAMRNIESDVGLVNMTANALMEVDVILDKCVYGDLVQR